MRRPLAHANVWCALVQGLQLLSHDNTRRNNQVSAKPPQMARAVSIVQKENAVCFAPDRCWFVRVID